MTTLQGMTWKHDRGLAPMLATAEVFNQRNPELQIAWEARSLFEFGATPLEELARRYDLLVIDHPHAGAMSDSGSFLPLDQHLPPSVLAMHQADSVGKSFESYKYQGHQWALPIDAAAQVSGYRPDLLAKFGFSAPQTWNDVFDLAREKPGFVTVPLGTLDAICSFFSLCANFGEDPFESSDCEVVSTDVGEAALERLQQLLAISSPECLDTNPIRTWERMSTSDEIGFCPLAFGYSNYARAGYRTSAVSFGNIPRDSAGNPRGSVLGGAGIAISVHCAHVQEAVQYAQGIAHPNCQRTIYFESGGQPASLAAWRNPAVNEKAGNFFTSTLSTLIQSYMRPRWTGMNEFQIYAADLVSKCLRGLETISGTLETMNRVYAQIDKRRTSQCAH